MPLYKVLARQWVEEITEIEVEADSPEEAKQKIEDAEAGGYLDIDFDFDWEDGSDINGFAVYGIRDEDGIVLDVG